MSRLLIVVDRAKDWAPYYPSEDVLTFDQYLQFSAPPSSRVRVINLCQSARYLSKGYYCSLLAEARGHHVVPSVMTLNDLGRKGLFSLELEELDESVINWLEASGSAIDPASDERAATHEVRIRTYFGQAEHPDLKPVARALFERFPCPILEVVFKRRKQWQIESMKPAAPADLGEQEQDVFAAALDRFSSMVWRKPRTRRRYRYDLAVLVNPDEEMPPSDKVALKRFEKAGRKLGINVELITRRDYMRLPEYDGLFIRETTAIDHHTYRFARKAAAEKNAVEQVISELGFPVVIKIPDGAFSRGVTKAEDEKTLRAGLKDLFKQSALVLAQEYLYTDYDWRIGVLGGRAIYACKYMMVKGHWQIYQHGESESESGGFETMPTYEVPRNVIQAALNATKLIGNGLYGVDIKQSGNRVAVIEVNDNPSIDAGVEDRFLGGELYTLIMQEFLSRMEENRRR